METHIYKNLLELDKKELALFIANTYGFEKTFDANVDCLCAMNDPPRLFKLLKKRVQSFNRRKRFVSYGESGSLAAEMLQTIETINVLMLPHSAKKAFELSDIFLKGAENTFDRIDDSDGNISDVYIRNVELWLIAATRWREGKEKCKLNWNDEIVKRIEGDPVGLCDDLLPNTKGLLSEAELRQLAWRFENEARKHLPQGTEYKYNYDASIACRNLEGVAEALDDIELFERATLLRNPEPNELQRFSLARFCFRIQNFERALYWLEDPTERFVPQGTISSAQSGIHLEVQRIKLMIEAWEALGNKEKIKAGYCTLYNLEPTVDAYEKMVSFFNASDRKKIKKAAIDAAQNLYFSEGVPLLLHFDEKRLALECFLGQIPEVIESHYRNLVPFLKEIKPYEIHLMESLCYRSLLVDILENSRTTAYTIAAKYYTTIALLETKITDYKGHQNFENFSEIIKEKHGRKTSFWRHIDPT